MISPDTPVYALPEENLIPVGDYLTRLAPIPPSRMFLPAWPLSHPRGCS